MTSERDDAQYLAEARAYFSLGLFREAEQAVEPIVAGPHYAEAHTCLIEIFLAQGKAQEAASIAKRLMDECTYNYQTLVFASVAFCLAGKADEARDAIAKVENFGIPLSVHAYQTACVEALRGKFPDSLRWLEIEARSPRFWPGRGIDDSDLAGVWEWIAEGDLRLEDAHRILQIPFHQACAYALHSGTTTKLDSTDLNIIPKKMRRLFRWENGIFAYHCGEASKNPTLASRFRAFWQARTEAIVAKIETGQSRALKMVLAAQPRYAADHAAWNNQLGVRYHLMWTLAHDPRMIDAFRALPELRDHLPLIESVAVAQEIDSDFCWRMEEVWKQGQIDSDAGWIELEKTPKSLRGHPIVRLREASLHGRDHDYPRALAIYLRLCSIWPKDVAPFANAADCFMQLGEWKKAQAVLSLAPKCFERFRLYQMQLRDIKRGFIGDISQPLPFTGQPDLGGLLFSDEKEPFFPQQDLLLSIGS